MSKRLFVTLLAVIGIVCVSYALGQYSNFGSGSGGDPFSNPFGDGNGGGYNPDDGNGGYNPDNGNGGYNPDNGNSGYNPDNGNSGMSGVLEYAGSTSETPAEPDYSGTSSEPDDYSAFSGSEESTYAPLAAQGTWAHGTTSPNIYWIVDNQGTRMQTMNIRRGSRAREELIPAVSGPLVVFERYPSGQILKYYPGNVQRNNKYRLIFEADTRGRHDCVYWVHGRNGWFSSNVISYNVT